MAASNAGAVTQTINAVSYSAARRTLHGRNGGSFTSTQGSFDLIDPGRPRRGALVGAASSDKVGVTQPHGVCSATSVDARCRGLRDTRCQGEVFSRCCVLLGDAASAGQGFGETGCHPVSLAVLATLAALNVRFHASPATLRQLFRDIAGDIAAGRVTKNRCSGQSIATHHRSAVAHLCCPLQTDPLPNLRGHCRKDDDMTKIRNAAIMHKLHEHYCIMNVMARNYEATLRIGETLGLR
jgi:hypothetical protein